MPRSACATASLESMLDSAVSLNVGVIPLRSWPKAIHNQNDCISPGPNDRTQSATTPIVHQHEPPLMLYNCHTSFRLRYGTLGVEDSFDFMGAAGMTPLCSLSRSNRQSDCSYSPGTNDKTQIGKTPLIPTQPKKKRNAK